MTTSTAEVQRRSSLASVQDRRSDQKQKEVREAVERVYRRYGTDLTAFRKDRQRVLEKRAG